MKNIIKTQQSMQILKRPREPKIWKTYYFGTKALTPEGYLLAMHHPFDWKDDED